MTNRQRIFLQQTLAIEKGFYGPFARLAMAMRERFIRDLKKYGKDAALSNVSLFQQHDKVLPLLKRIYRTAGLNGAKRQNQLLQDQLTERDLAQIAQARKKAGGFGRNEQWIRDVLKYLEMNGLDMATNITETMKGDILSILTKSVEQGWPIDRIVLELRRTNLVEARAKVIARTEVIRAANVGHKVAAESTPYEVDKKWNAATDHRTRHSHRMVNGHITDEYGAFKVAVYKGDKPTGTYDLMQFPGDPNAHASNVVNCRCRVTYIPKRDANGRLIMRNPNQARVIPMNPPTQLPVTGIAAALKANIKIGIE